MSKIIDKIKRLLNVDNKLNTVEYQQKILSLEIENIKILLGKQYSQKLNSIRPLNNIHQVEFKIFSQWGDDGIIQYLVNYLDVSTKTFVEFGVENYQESTTRFLLLNNNWSGLVIDASRDNIEHIKNAPYYHNYSLTAIHSFVTIENINDLFASHGFTDEIGLLHIDIDGNDYWIWKALQIAKPVIVIIEYNAVFGSERSITIPYQSNFNRTVAHFSNLYFGASIQALCNLADEKGYFFIGCTSNGNNAYFIRKDKIKDLPVFSPVAGFVDSKFRESRDVDGKLTYVEGKNRINLLKGLPVYNTSKKSLEII